MNNNSFRKQSLVLMIYDMFVAVSTCFLILYLYMNRVGDLIAPDIILIQSFVFIVILFAIRIIFKIYSQVWRYAGVQCYLRLMVSDGVSSVIYYIVERLIVEDILLIKRISFSNTISMFAVDLLAVLAMRIMYRYCFKYGNNVTRQGKLLSKLLKIFSLGRVKIANENPKEKQPVAILGAGRIGTSLANELLNNVKSLYVPVMFLENDKEKVGRQALGMPIYSEDIPKEKFEKYGIDEVIFTIPNMDINKRQMLYQRYKEYGLKVKVYDFPLLGNSNDKQTLREFDVEDLLFRKPVLVIDEDTKRYYKDKVVLITGGGGSIGSEMCRQVAKMAPKQIILFDIYENGVYDIQTEMRFAYENKLDLKIEIGNICDKKALSKVFDFYKPNVVIMAAAHKHVPLMEHNVVESIKNNVFGTLNTVEVSEKYGVDRVIMVSTDKAVNPTNVMGATKRVCEMIVKNHSEYGKTKTTFSMTRFGNVLGSAGSVIPLFKRQLAKGGPLTITDYRIIRYFMTIPEASQLVLKSGAMAKNGELFVLDMGKPIKILELAESMIKLSGLEPYKDIDIQEVGLRPGEKLYEELLIKTETLEKTKDKLIFIEEDKPLSNKELETCLKNLKKAIDSYNDEEARKVLKEVVPTFKNPDEINKEIH